MLPPCAVTRAVIFESLESKKRLDNLAPEGNFIAREAIERAVVEIGDPKPVRPARRRVGSPSSRTVASFKVKMRRALRSEFSDEEWRLVTGPQTPGGPTAETVHWLAGVRGFEPPHGGINVRCFEQ